jgi:hypothetical protein
MNDAVLSHKYFAISERIYPTNKINKVARVVTLTLQLFLGYFQKNKK